MLSTSLSQQAVSSPPREDVFSHIIEIVRRDFSKIVVVETQPPEGALAAASKRRIARIPKKIAPRKSIASATTTRAGYEFSRCMISISRARLRLAHSAAA
jgi:hypothetical protein